MRTGGGVIISILAVGVAGLPVSLNVAPVAAETSATCPTVVDDRTTTEQVPAGLNVVTCELVGVDLVLEGGLLDMIVEVPPPGQFTMLVAEGKTHLSGGTFTVGVSDAGEISYPDQPEGGPSSTAVGLTAGGLMEELELLLADPSQPQTDPCKDGASRTFGGKWKANPSWYINQAGRPSNISADDAVSQIRMAKNNVSGANNNCGLTDNVNRDASYAGLTTVGLNINSNPSAGTVRCVSGSNADSISVVGIGATPSGILGYACVYYSTSDTDAFRGGDILISNNPNTFVLDGNALGCVDQYDLQSLVTHEWGHFFGLRHVGEAKHGTLTMSPVLGQCTRAERTLGLGDIVGLESLY